MISHRVRFTIRSMTIRTPSSLKWLINQYQNQSRQLREIEKQIEQLSAQRSIIVEHMSSFAKVIEYHDIPITADDIPLLRSSQKQTEYKYGQMTKLIYKYLGGLPADCCASISDVVNFCLGYSDMRHLESEVTLKQFRKAIRKRLKDLAYLGKIKRVDYGSKSCEPKYRAN